MKFIIGAACSLLLVLLASVYTYAEGPINSIDRLRDIQQNRNITISPDQRETIISKCNKGKVQIVKIQSTADVAAKKRLVVYGDIQKEIKAIELRMTKQGADASEIDLLIGKLQQNIDRFDELARYANQLSEDITSIDCLATPELYLAGTDEYKDTRLNLYDAATQLKATILEAPQSTFTPLIGRLKI